VAEMDLDQNRTRGEDIWLSVWTRSQVSVKNIAIIFHEITYTQIILILSAFINDGAKKKNTEKGGNK